MSDLTTDQTLRVSTDGTAGPYIRLRVNQLDDLTRLLTSHGIGYDVDELSLSLDGAPAVTVVNLGRRADAAAVQRLLDAGR